MRILDRLKAFTLTELLLAIAIVGVIAALVLPAAVSKFNDELLNNAYDRDLQSITSALETLPVTENKSSFASTMMYVTTDNGNYDNTSGKFIKKYLRVAKYCGNSNGDCFADKYYQYADYKKNEYTPTYKGGCAVLKSGASLCLEPQVGAASIKGLIDINGPKGPNVLERDLRTIEIPAYVQQSRNTATEAVNSTSIKTFTPHICVTEPDSKACCETFDSSTLALDQENHWCCETYSDFASSHSDACGVSGSIPGS